jgi:hypothetical protein
MVPLRVPRRPRKKRGSRAANRVLVALGSRFRAGLSGENVGTISQRFADVGDDWRSSCPALCRVSTPSSPAPKDVDGRAKPGQDDSSFAVTACFPRTGLRASGNDARRDRVLTVKFVPLAVAARTRNEFRGRERRVAVLGSGSAGCTRSRACQRRSRPRRPSRSTR